MNEPTIHITGYLAGKPKLRTVETASGAAVVTKLRVAVTPRRRDRAEQWSDGETIWFDVSAWRAAATNCAATLDQGDRVVVSGKLSQRTWTDAEGREHPGLHIAADSVGLDLARSAAMVARRSAPAQRLDEPAGGWVSTGQVDRETGEVQIGEMPIGEVESDPADDDPVDLEPADGRREPVAV